MERDHQHDDEAVAAIRYAIDSGITHIDTAERYAEGHSEELVGRAVEDYDRSKLFLVSKILPEHLGYDDVLRAAERSLHRLGTDYLDMYLLHNPNPLIPIEETMRAMDRLVDEGRIRNIGLSNFLIEEMEAAMRVTKHPIVANQLRLNLASRRGEEMGLLHHAQIHDWLFIAFRPVRDVVLLQPAPAILTAMCEKYDASPAQVALNWLIGQKNIVTIVRSSSLEHVDDALNALRWSMSPEDIELLRSDFPLPKTLPVPLPPAF